MNSLVQRRGFLDKCKFYSRFILYEVYYYLLGCKAIFEDVLFKKFNRCTLPKRDQCVAVVTGGARGIGRSVVKNLLLCNMTVVIGCRQVSAGEKLIAEILNEGVVINKDQLFIFELDLSSLKSVKSFAEKVCLKFSSISLLVNNAGIMFPPYQETEDGYESQFQVNYLAPYFLTYKLLPLLEQQSTLNSHNPRIVNVTSCAHEVAMALNLKDLNFKSNYIPSAAYAQSKLAQVLFTLELDRRLQESMSQVRVLAVHPGIVNTELFDGTVLKQLFPWVLNWICKSVDEGALSVTHACVSQNLANVGGVYLSNCCFKTPSTQALDRTLQNELFTTSLTLLGKQHIKEFYGPFHSQYNISS